jgi:AraC-like DNA-binding protein
LTFPVDGVAKLPHDVARVAIRWLPLLFAVLTMIAAIRHWSGDLLESRRRLRAFVVVGGTIYTVAMVVLRLQSGHGMLAAPAALLDIVFLLTIVAVPTFSVVRLLPGELFAPPAVRPPITPIPVPLATSELAADAETDSRAETAVDAQEQQLLEKLARLMAEQRVYAQENLTVATLAAQLKVPEYRLRRAINRSLGHRNFNAYINEFRLREAQAALSDSGKRDLPILTIALTAGFQSIGPFNRAFKTMTGLTPTEFRQKNSADS